VNENYRLIYPLLRPLQPLLEDDEISEVMINAGCRCFIERNGRLEPRPEIKISEDSLRAGIHTVARLLDQELDEESPLLDTRLPDGSRVAAVFAPVSVGGCTLTVRKFRSRAFSPTELVNRGMMTEEVSRVLQEAIRTKRTILLSGGTGSGKTTLLNALASHINHQERIVVIEDTAEISLSNPNLVRLEAKKEQTDRLGNITVRAITIRNLLRHSLRHRPDRIIVGEVRGEEAFDLLQAMNTGHGGSLTTVHANNARKALARLRTCSAMANTGIPHAAISSLIADSFDYIVQIERDEDGFRHVAEVQKMGRYDSVLDTFELQEVS
jgi:pilus assembly protein CpaF